MTVKLSILAYDKSGAKVSGSVEAATVADAAGEYESLKAYAEQEGWAADNAMFAAAKSFTTENLAKQTGAGDCQFCGSTVEGITMPDGKTFTAQQIATGRAEKMGKMNQVPAPVCSECWRKRGLSDQWKRTNPYIPRGR